MPKKDRQLFRIGKTNAGGQLGGTAFGQVPGAVKGTDSRGITGGRRNKTPK
jgi:hypothetical protein